MALLDLFDPIFKLLPEVRPPETKHTLKKRLLWSAIALVMFFVMGQINVIGLNEVSKGQLLQFQQVLASNIGTLITVGIGPIVLASIFLQLLIGAQIINIDLHDPLQRKKFASLQKLLAIVLSFFEAAAFAGFGVFPAFITVKPGMFLFVVLQIALGSIILLYLDELVSKHGIGSGIGLFIAGGVAGSFFWILFQPVIAIRGILNPDYTVNLAGRIFVMFQEILAGNIIVWLPIALAILFAVFIYVVVTFVEGMHVNIPVIVGRHGMGGRFPVKFLYVSNMPVILASALFANIQIWAAVFQGIPILNSIVNALAWATQIPRVQGQYSILEGIIISLVDPRFGLQAVFFELGHSIVFLILLTVLCVVFARFWIELANQGPQAVSEQLQKSNMSIPGFRSDPRIIRTVLDKYIPPITILGGAFVGLLAGLADLTLGSLASGTGILLTVGIVYRLYEEIGKEASLESSFLLKKFLNKG